MPHEQQSTVERSIVRTESPPLSIMVQERVTITREDALAAVDDMIDTINQSAWDVNQNNKLREALTEQIVIVLPANVKEDLTAWAAMSGSANVKRWLERAIEDKKQHTRIKMGENPMLWSNRGPTAILDEMEQVMNVENVDEAVRRRKMQVLIDHMRLYIP